MFKPALKSELSQISLTGMRAIVLLGLLIEAPRTLEDIREIFTRLNIMEPEHSDDIIRIDLNTLRAMGCEISRADIKTDFKYHMINHPFVLNLTLDELTVLKKAYNKIKEKIEVSQLLMYDSLFDKIAKCMSRGETKEFLCGISLLKLYDRKFLENLIATCKLHSVLEVRYQDPVRKTESLKLVVAIKLVLQNDKIYLCGNDLTNHTTLFLNVKRIKSILTKQVKTDDIQVNNTKIKFFLKNLDITDLEDNEFLIKSTAQGMLIQGTYYNDFIAMQRILSFGSSCTVIEPEIFKNKVIEKLRLMKEIYEK